MVDRPPPVPGVFIDRNPLVSAGQSWPYLPEVNLPRPSGAQTSTSNPLVLTLIALSLMVSLALVVVVLLSGSAHRRTFPLDK